MSTLTIRLPDGLEQAVRQLAAREGMSLDRLVAGVLAETVSIRMADLLEERAKRGNREAFERALAQVPDAPPVEGDELPEALKKLLRARLARAKRKTERNEP